MEPHRCQYSELEFTHVGKRRRYSVHKHRTPMMSRTQSSENAASQVKAYSVNSSMCLYGLTLHLVTCEAVLVSPRVINGRSEVCKTGVCETPPSSVPQTSGVPAARADT